MNNDAYGFIYITTNKINNKKYIGQKKIDDGSRWKSYLGSGVYLNKAILKYGRENFEREILEYAYSIKELDDLEFEYIKKHDAVNSENYYNAVNGGFTAKKLKEINSIPVINIDTGYVFSSINDARLWAKISNKSIKESFEYKHDINNKSKK